MLIQQQVFTKNQGWKIIRGKGTDPSSFTLVMAFGSTHLISEPSLFDTIKKQYPNADILLNSTSGEIADIHVNDDTISLTAIHFKFTSTMAVCTHISEAKNSFEAGRCLAESLEHKDLKNIIVISDGLQVNGSELVLGLQRYLPENVTITGGLAGDASFQKTLVGLNEVPVEGRIAAIGFYGSNLVVTHGSMGGWDPFGPERLITRSKNNVLYELDGKPALDIYKMYLGEYASDLPESGLLFPLSIRSDDTPLVRTILSVNEEDKSLIFAGNMPEGSYARLMKANMDRLIEGAATAAQQTMGKKGPDLALLISCVGRRLVLDQRVEEEVEAIRAIYGDHTAISGFYSYGEISPSFSFKKCELHNQTMTITTLSENYDAE